MCIIKFFIVFMLIIIIEYIYLCRVLVFFKFKKNVIYIELGFGVFVVILNDE